MPFPPNPMSLPQQPHGGGGAPPSLETQRGMTEEWMEKHLGPPRTSSAEDMIRQDKQMREGAGLPPTPRSPGKYGEKGYPLDMLAVKNWEARENFPEVFGSAVPAWAQGNVIDDQKMLWESQMSDSPRDEQLPWNSDLPPWNVGR